jgi:gliding motility associated protien GldN
MKKLILLFISILMIPTTGNTQDILDGATDFYDRKETVRDRKVQPYPHLRAADVMWSRKIWREIDLREKINHPFYYPEYDGEEHRIEDRKSLINVIYDAILVGELTAYANAALDDEFKQEMTPEEFDNVGGAKTVTQLVRDWSVDEDDPVYIQKTVRIPFDRNSVKKWRIKEEWYFDKQRSVMDVRIIGLCPMQEGKGEDGELTGFFDPLFWVYFPDARPYLAKAEIFNLMKNDAERRTFDDIFWKRMFSSVIIKESNVMDRKVNEYMIGLDAILKSEEIKAELFNIEHDLWEY